MRFGPALGALLVLLSLSSCNTLSKEECVAADWRVVGETDGAAGYDPQQRFADHAKACGKAAVVPDQTEWYKGYQSGLSRYCTPLGGLARGEAGDRYRNVCPAQSEADFLKGYGLGRKAYDLRREIDSLRSRIAFAEMDIDRLEAGLRSAKGPDRAHLRELIFTHERDIRRMERDQEDAEFALHAVERDIEWFRRNPAAPLPVPGY